MNRSSILVGLPWYHLEAYDAARALMEDGGSMPETFDQWQAAQIPMETEAQARGTAVMRVYIEAKTFRAWCEAHDTKPNAAGRLAYATEVAAAARDLNSTGRFDIIEPDAAE
jgi:hypothetical protein